MGMVVDLMVEEIRSTSISRNEFRLELDEASRSTIMII